MPAARDPAGAGLIEALVATALVVTAAATLAGLSSLAMRTILAGRDRTMCTVLTQAGLEVLRASPAIPPASPADSLERDIEGFSERLDAGGRVAGRDQAHAGTVFTRRWRVTAFPGRPGVAVVTVQVFRCQRESRTASGCPTAGFAVRASAVRSELIR